LLAQGWWTTDDVIVRYRIVMADPLAPAKLEDRRWWGGGTVLNLIDESDTTRASFDLYSVEFEPDSVGSHLSGQDRRSIHPGVRARRARRAQAASR
jgi:hypothetical protein